jgi:hypothetical protein
MNGLHQQLAAKRRQIAADEATVAADEHLHATHQAKERLPRLRAEAATLETDIELGEAAHHQMTTALSNMRTIGNGDGLLSQAITEQKTAIWWLRDHLGEPETPEAES